jgi:plasmid stabilization system protein ParE
MLGAGLVPLKLRLLRRANRDLLEILDFIAARERSDALARRFGDRLIATCENLTRAPGAGAPSKAADDVRKITDGAYKIYYRVTDQDVIILRIWDGRRGSEPRL